MTRQSGSSSDTSVDRNLGRDLGLVIKDGDQGEGSGTNGKERMRILDRHPAVTAVCMDREEHRHA